MSLDEPTHRDLGGADGFGDKTVRTAGTLPGVGDANARNSKAPLAPRVPSVPPPRPPMPSTPPLAAGGNGVMGTGPHVPLAPSPLAVVHQPRPMDPMRLSRPDPREGSISAYGPDDTNQSRARARKGSSFGVGVIAFGLAAAAIGGIAFFAVSTRPGATPDPKGTPATDAPSVTSGTPTSVHVPIAPATAMAPTITTSTVAPTTIPPGMIAIGDDLSTIGVKDAGAAVRSPAAQPANGGAGHGPRNPAPRTTGNDPPSGATNESKPALAPDPFGTPE
jgi:hypothetical protein